MRSSSNSGIDHSIADISPTRIPAVGAPSRLNDNTALVPETPSPHRSSTIYPLSGDPLGAPLAVGSSPTFSDNNLKPTDRLDGPNGSLAVEISTETLMNLRNFLEGAGIG